tara:strand:+ start:2802 stop:4019 length:1218 start_codon:yes stop_codon:yes gene_type:complete
MASTIQIKRSTGTSAPSSLDKGELAWADHGSGGAAGNLYIGDMTPAGAIVRKIGGTLNSTYVSDILNNTSLTGNPTAPTQAANNNSTRLATTAYVDNQVTSHVDTIAEASDTNIASTGAGHVLVHDGTDSWDNKFLSGDVSMTAGGVVSVNSVQNNSVALGTGTTGAYVSTIVGTANEVEVSGSGSETAQVTIGLPNDVTIAGNLTVSGTTTTVNSTTVSIADPVFVVGQNASDDNKDRGIEFKYNDGVARIGFFGYDDTDAKFKYLVSATNNSEIFSGTLGNVAFGNIDGTLTTASQTNITGVGTISTGAWNATAISATKGGTGINTSSSTGVPSVSSGTWSIQAQTPVTLGGTGIGSVASNGILVGAGTSDLTVLTIGSAGQFLKVSSGGAPEWSDSIDGGTF